MEETALPDAAGQPAGAGLRKLLAGFATEEYPRPRSRGGFLLAVSSGILVFLAFPVSYPFSAATAWKSHLAWLAPVPLFLAAQGTGPRRGFVLGWFSGMSLACCACVWVLLSIRRFTPLGPVLSSFVFMAWLCWFSIPAAACGWALGRCRRTSQVLWVLPLWVGLEHWFPRVFPWYLGGALQPNPWFLQCADLLGASGLSALVLLVATVIYRLVLRFSGGERTPFPRWSVASAVVLVALALVYGALRLGQVRGIEAGAARLRVGFVQGNVDPRDDEAAENETRTYLDDSMELLERHPDIDLLVWPEGSLRPTREELRRLRGFRVPLVAGSALEEGGAIYNVAAYLRPGARPEIYRKNIPMPFGENLGWLPESIRRRLFVGEIGLGTDNPVMELGPYRFRNLICYEAVVPSYVRETASGADFAVNLTEDVWYGDTTHPAQHLSVLITCAVQSRLPIVRCTSAGPSGIVALTGEFRGTSRVFEDDRFVEVFAPARTGTLYAAGGWLFPGLCLLAGIALQGLVGRAGGSR